MAESTLRESVTIRPAKQGDLQEVRLIESVSFPTPWPNAAFVRFLGQPGFLVAIANDTPAPLIAGFAIATIDIASTPTMGHLKDLAVHPAFRREGIGKALLEDELSMFETRDVEGVKLEVRESNEAARSLYRTYGFEATDRRRHYYDDGEDAIVMIRSSIE